MHSKGKLMHSGMRQMNGFKHCLLCVSWAPPSQKCAILHKKLASIVTQAVFVSPIALPHNRNAKHWALTNRLILVGKFPLSEKDKIYACCKLHRSRPFSCQPAICVFQVQCMSGVQDDDERSGRPCRPTRAHSRRYDEHRLAGASAFDAQPQGWPQKGNWTLPPLGLIRPSTLVKQWGICILERHTF